MTGERAAAPRVRPGAPGETLAQAGRPAEGGDAVRPAQAPLHAAAPAELSSGQGDDASGQPVVTASARPLRPRSHRRVVRVGTEKFDPDGVKLDPEDAQTEQMRLQDDDQRILSELPPHWAVFDARTTHQH